MYLVKPLSYPFFEEIIAFIKDHWQKKKVFFLWYFSIYTE